MYKVADQVKTAAGQREQVKFYYFNSDTLLLERVTYEITRNGATVEVEEKLGLDQRRGTAGGAAY